MASADLIKNKEFMGTIALIGIIMMLTAIFVTWLDAEGQGITGLNLFDFPDSVTEDWQKMIPMIITILAVIVLILEFISILIPSTSAKIDAALPLIVFVVSLIALILAILCISWVNDNLENEETIGAGAWIVLVGSIIALCSTAGQAFGAIKKKKEE